MNKRYVFVLFAFLSTVFMFSQEGNVKGTLIDIDGLYVPYALVSIPNLKKGTVSDADGKFLLLNIPIGNQTFKIEYLGYADKDVEVDVKENETLDIKIVLVSQSEELDGVLITG